MLDKAPRTVRPLQTEYQMVGFIFNQYGNYVYEMDEEEFVGKCMTVSHGSMNPNRVREIYKQLMEEAGI